MGIKIYLRKEMGMFLYITVGIGWELEYVHGNEREYSIETVIPVHLY